jgi:hypothetical protein
MFDWIAADMVTMPYMLLRAGGVHPNLIQMPTLTNHGGRLLDEWVRYAQHDASAVTDLPAVSDAS